MRSRVMRLAVFVIAVSSILVIQSFTFAAEEGKVVKLDFIPLYQLTAEQAIEKCYANLAQLGIDTSMVTLTTLNNVPNKIAVQSTQDLIDIVRQIMGTIDPMPQVQIPPPPAQQVITDFQVHNLSPAELGMKLDEVMVTFLNFTTLDSGAANFFVYARDTQGTNSITFYIPNIDEVNQSYFKRSQGYNGYKVYIRATENENQYITNIKGLITTIDMPLAGKEYQAIQLYYTEVGEAIKSLKALGYYAIDTTNDTATASDAIKQGASPVIYSAPSVKVQGLRLSTNFGSGSSRDIRAGQFTTLAMDDPVATGDIYKLIVYGSKEEIEAVKSYIALIDVPARQILIEASVIEINVDALTDLGIKSVEGTDDIIQGNVSSLFPGEGTAGNGSNMFIYDDAGQPAGSFNAAIQALVQDGKATIKARPKVVTVDGRQAIISIGRQVPVVQETQTTNERSVFEINFVPVGITLNIKPRIGAGAREVQMQVDAVVSNVETINNVIADASLRAPELNTREVHAIVRIPNHQSLILGGLISTETERRTFKVPFLGDLPLIGKLFQRSKTAEGRTEIVIVITPHIADEIEPRAYEGAPNPYLVDDSNFTPASTEIFDEVMNIMMPSTYLIKQTDIQGMDLSRLEPVIPRDMIVKNSTDDPVLLTLRNIVRKLKLVKELRMLEGPAPDWMDKETMIYNAEAFLVLYLEETNKLTIDELIPGRQIVIPSNPNPEEGFESNVPLWNSINFNQLAQKYIPMQDVVRTLMVLDGKEPPKKDASIAPQPPSQPVMEIETPGSDGTNIAYGPYKISLVDADGANHLVTVSLELVPVEGAEPTKFTERVNDIEALALALLGDYKFEEFTTPEGSGSAAADLAAGIDELLGGGVVSEINLFQSS